MDVHSDMFPAPQVNQNNEDDSNGAIEYNNHTNKGSKRHKQVTYKDMMNRVNELVHTVQDSDELVKYMLMSFDEYIRKIFMINILKSYSIVHQTKVRYILFKQVHPSFH